MSDGEIFSEVILRLIVNFRSLIVNFLPNPTENCFVILLSSLKAGDIVEFS